MDRLLDRFRGDRRAAPAAGLLAATGLIFLVSLSTRSIGSLPIAVAVLLPFLVGTLAALVFALTKQGTQSEGHDTQRLRGLVEQGRQLAIYDRETGFYAYWYFSLRLQEEIARSDRHKEPFLLLLVEAAHARISPEKEQQLFSCMRTGFRTTDLVAHLGNLRFVALLPDAGLDQAGIVRDRINSALGDDDIHLGIACYPTDGTDWASLLHAAESLPSAA